MVNSKEKETVVSETFSEKINKLVLEYVDGQNKKLQDDYEKNMLYYEKQRSVGNYVIKPKKPAKYTILDMTNAIAQKYKVVLGKDKLQTYRKNNVIPSLDIIAAFSDFFKVSYEYLLNPTCLIKNEAAEKIENQLVLGYNAVTNLKSIKNTWAINFLNAILGDGDSEKLLAQLYNNIYNMYKIRDSYYNGQISMEMLTQQEIIRALTISRILEECLTTSARDIFEKQLKQDNEIQEYMSKHPEL